MKITSCYGCVAPKRHLGCHAKCPDYLGEKAKNDAVKAAKRKAYEEETAYQEVRYHNRRHR